MKQTFDKIIIVMLEDKSCNSVYYNITNNNIQLNNMRSYKVYIEKNVT